MCNDETVLQIRVLIGAKGLSLRMRIVNDKRYFWGYSLVSTEQLAV